MLKEYIDTYAQFEDLLADINRHAETFRTTSNPYVLMNTIKSAQEMEKTADKLIMLIEKAEGE